MGRSSGAASKSPILPSRSPSATWKPKGLPTLNRKAGSADFEGRALRGWRFANVVCEPKPRPGEGRGRGEDMKGLRPLHASLNEKYRFVNVLFLGMRHFWGKRKAGRPRGPSQGLQLHPGVIPFQNLLIIPALLGHGVGPHLAHAHPVAVSGHGKQQLLPLLLQGEVG